MAWPTIPLLRGKAAKIFQEYDERPLNTEEVASLNRADKIYKIVSISNLLKSYFKKFDEKVISLMPLTKEMEREFDKITISPIYKMRIMLLAEKEKSGQEIVDEINKVNVAYHAGELKRMGVIEINRSIFSLTPKGKKYLKILRDTVRRMYKEDEEFRKELDNI